MVMGGKLWRAMAVSCLVALLASSMDSLAQEPIRTIQQEKPEDQKPAVKPVKPVPGKPHLKPIKAPRAPEVFKLLGAEFTFNKLVTGAPYSAIALTETSQTLSDGNEITRRIETKVYRDGEGRTRREQTLDTLAKYTAADEPYRIVFIDDPVAGLQFTLDPRTHTAHRIKGTPHPFGLVVGKPDERGATEPAAKKIGTLEPKIVAKGKVPPGPAKMAKDDIKEAKGDLKESRGYQKETKEHQKEAKDDLKAAKDHLKGATGDAEQKQPTIPSSPAMKSPSELAATKKVESLGKQVVEGIEAEGTRSTVTIPAGEIGNRLPIEVTEERWYSPELQILVMSKHHDPRSGDKIYRLTNINRSEPDRSLFELPSDYQWAGPGS